MGKAVLVVALFALLVYGVLTLIERRRAGRAPKPRGHGLQPPPPPGRPLSPDDDPDFLRDLDRKRRREQRDNPD